MAIDEKVNTNKEIIPSSLSPKHKKRKSLAVIDQTTLR